MNDNIKKLTLAGLLIALGVACSTFSFPVGASRCSPVQHMVNVLAAVLLGPAYGVGMAFVTSLLRIAMATGTLLAFPGSMVGALCCGLAYKALRNKNEVAAILVTLVAEMLGTGVLGGLCAWPVSILFMNGDAATLAVTAYIIPFLISTVAGSIIAGVLVFALRAGGALKILQRSLELK